MAEAVTLQSLMSALDLDVKDSSFSVFSKSTSSSYIKDSYKDVEMKLLRFIPAKPRKDEDKLKTFGRYRAVFKPISKVAGVGNLGFTFRELSNVTTVNIKGEEHEECGMVETLDQMLMPAFITVKAILPKRDYQDNILYPYKEYADYSVLKAKWKLTATPDQLKDPYGFDSMLNDDKSHALFDNPPTDEKLAYKQTELYYRLT